MKTKLFSLIISISTLSACEKTDINSNNQTVIQAMQKDSNLRASATPIQYTMPDETQPHEGTWLQWPHQYEYGTTYRNRLDATWVAMAKALVSGEKVHIIAYDATEKSRITNLLTTAGVPQTNVDFQILKTNDVWVRDNGPIYVRDASGALVIQDWGFNGWGNKTKYQYDNTIPASVSVAQGKPKVDLNSVLVVEGGAFELDGNGTFMATKSSIINANRNPGKTQATIEQIFTQNLGVTNFIWLNGVAGLEITDMHIDGFARFANKNTIVTMSQNDLIYWQLTQADITKLFAAKDKNGASYNFVKLPLTKNNVVTTYGKNLGYQGSYINFYVANNRVLVPNYNDPNDATANQIIQQLFPTKTVVGIDVRNLYANGGMIHCVTQQQPK